MTKRLLDYDPIRKMGCYMNVEGGRMTFTHEQDISALIDQNKRSANDDDKTKRGMKNDWWKYASIPAVVEIEWLQKFGVDLNDPQHKGRVFKLLNHPDYRYLKTTNKVHTVAD